MKKLIENYDEKTSIYLNLDSEENPFEVQVSGIGMIGKFSSYQEAVKGIKKRAKQENKTPLMAFRRSYNQLFAVVRITSIALRGAYSGLSAWISYKNKTREKVSCGYLYEYSKENKKIVDLIRTEQKKLELLEKNIEGLTNKLKLCSDDKLRKYFGLKIGGSN